uniref:DNA polymerase kappa n=1 Tax=Fundulus heteroclitus TaxID=8078 RepID=A0A3Q2P160_FUNHE
MENGVGSTKEENLLSRMALNDNKAGMEGLDRDKINRIIMEASKGSRFYENELKKEQQVNQRIEKMMQQKTRLTEQQLQRAQAQVEKMASELERSRDLSRAIVHVDMDAFYAAVEMRDSPELKDKPMAVGSMSMLSTSNYHARKYGVRAAMPGFIAKRLCPGLVIVPLNFDKYRAVSEEVREIFAEYDPNFQPMSLDEAYLDFTAHLEQRQSWPDKRKKIITAKQNQTFENTVEGADLSPVLFEDSLSSSGGDAGGPSEVFGTSVEEAVREMRFRIEQKTTLTASAGIAPNMMLAKVCSDKNKPNGQYRLPPTREAVMDFTQKLPVRKVCGIGKVSEKMLNALGITTCSDLSQRMALLSLLFSETSWHHFLQISLGLSSTHIPRHEERKSMSTERTFKELSKPEEQFSLCRELCEDLADDLKKEALKGKTVTLKLKNVNFEVKTKAQTLPYAVATAEDIFAVAKELLKMEIESESPQPLRLRLMGGPPRTRRPGGIFWRSTSRLPSFTSH